VVLDLDVRLARHEREGDRDEQAERAIGPRQGVEEVAVLFLRAAHERAVGEHQLGGDDIVIEETILVRGGLNAHTH